MTVVIRDGKPADHGYVRSTWSDSYREAVLPWLPMGVARRGLSADIAAKLATAKLVIACDAEDEDRIYGWALGEPGVLHYVYMRDTRRKQGHGAALILAAAGHYPTRCTYLTPSAQIPAARRGIAWRRKS